MPLRTSSLPVTRRLGRPPASVGDHTRVRILDAARACFGDRGYVGTTTRQIADTAMLTTAAIYHYFGSKADLYRAAHEQVHLLVYERYNTAVAGHGSLGAEFGAVLAASHALNEQDPSLARFLVTARTDQRRYPELALPPDLPPQRGRFHDDLVARAVARREVAPADAQVVTETLRTLLGGLVYSASEDLEQQSRVIDGIERLLMGTLLGRSTRITSVAGA